MRALLTVAQALAICQRHEHEADWDFWALTEAQIWAELLVLEAQNDR